MEKYIYIKKDIPQQFIDFPEPLSPEEYNNLGETWNDYLNNKWVLLDDDQVEFLNEHPGATVKEVWNMEMDPISRPVELAIAEKIYEIDRYDNSINVNEFTINGYSMWLSVEERQQIATQISANETAGRDTMTRWYDGISFTFPIINWKQMLVALEIYAGDAKNVTESHKATVKTLQSVEEVDNYNYQIGYPEKLHF